MKAYDESMAALFEGDDDGSVWSDKGITCPYCKKIQRDVFEIPGAYTEDGGETNCGSCGKEFRFSTYVSYTWTSYRDKGDA